MDNQSLVNVLSILRRLAKANPNQTAAQLITDWTGERLSDASLLKVAAYLVEQCSEAVTVLAHTDLPDEVRAGLSETLEGMERAFSLMHIHNPPHHSVKHVTGSISTLGMLLTVAHVDIQQAPPEEAVELAKQVEELLAEFKNDALDPLVRSIAEQHLQALATLLRHVNIFGLEAALATYFELLARLRRAEANSTPESKKAAKPLTEKIKSWSETFKSLDAVLNAGERMLGRATIVAGLLTYFSS